ncbi:MULTISPECIES: M23 family metallopeptidase [unclassified Pseudoalteromonas]|uniref:M23 family metallopeptidase n=2 Tax=Bacteria TaxID=2 RepID=UPI0025B4FC36|nr:MULTISPECIES: M23 family metallopeptidase [unclassified Pseudoalteromonas]MDN3376963.1 M23 family metallopeptidase [Pseudoalteromonas sp. APC 3893]MDN3387327.1 M23 family metallopeptidase [Pseudoalteromonas sp. APC 4017]
MSVFIKSFYHKLFPVRQLLIRQNGEVKHVILAPWLQVFAVFCILTAITWLTVSTLQVYSQTNIISDIEQSQITKQQKWQQQQQAQQRLHEQQLEQLATLEQKHALLQSMIESLPDSLSKAEDSTTLEIEEKQQQSDLHEPLIDESKGSHIPLQQSSSLEQRLAALSTQYKQSFNKLETHIDQRQKNILTMLKGAGLDTAFANQLNYPVNDSAQGGPLNLFDESRIPSEFLTTADKLLSLNNLESLLSELPQSLPAADYYISSSYGLRKDPMNGRRAFHKGVDLAGWHKTEIFAPADGTVLRAGRNGGYGNFIELEHKNGFVTRFGHLNKIKVKKGQSVTKNDVIGLMGSTGRSTSTHLHYEVLLNDKHVNPVKITKALSRVR